MVYEVLVTLQFCRGITAYIFVPITGHGTVENIHCYIQDTVLRVPVLKDNLVHGALGEGLVEVLGGHKIIGIEVALSCGKKVYCGKKADAGCGHPLASLLVNRPEKKAERGKDKKKRADCIGPEERDAVFYKRIHQNILHTFVGGSGESAEHSRGQPAQETEAAGDRQGYPAGLK